MRTKTPALKTDSLNSSNDSPLSGLYLFGSVRQRSKRLIPADKPTTEIVTYMIVDNDDRHYFVDDYSPSQYYSVGQQIQFPVYVKTYKKKSGDLSYSLNVQKPFIPTVIGEEF